MKYPYWYAVLTLFCLPGWVLAQNENDEAAYLTDPKSLSFAAADSSFLVKFRFRMQNRVSLLSNSGTDLGINTVDARIRRLRLRRDGFVASPKLRYYIPLSFSRADLESDDTPQVVRDAILFYHVNERFYLGFGQTKLPGTTLPRLSPACARSNAPAKNLPAATPTTCATTASRRRSTWATSWPTVCTAPTIRIRVTAGT